MEKLFIFTLLISSVFSSWNSKDSLCKDRVNATTGKNECDGYKHLCTLDGYSVIMTQECPVTCGKCGCVDLPNPSSGITFCSSLKDKCTDASYKARMSVQCKKTCGLC
ncbi:hypothetical protein PRIPAC_86129 [Pristionchus pacificus]|uniref:ShK domain-containing protein n=1 Tax=Pristionchus pacificus TaxID=54126 RepID=A0A2A6C4N3_PRIPA|nr:hypothetical protein PRIPAC_86129 [Pristionchus pacificus]|eukprot:PDM73182.1 ShK domain-containing protein [Pristionchus pacificus]